MSADDMVPVTDLDELDAAGGSTVVSEAGQGITLFYHEEEGYAVDNRCPHTGFHLTRGTVEEGILTFHWRPMSGNHNTIVCYSKSNNCCTVWLNRFGQLAETCGDKSELSETNMPVSTGNLHMEVAT